MEIGIDQYASMRAKTDEFSLLEGRRPRMMLCGLQLMKETGEVKTLATALADMGFDIDVSPTGVDAQGAVQDALDNDVYAILTVVGKQDKSVVTQLKECMRTMAGDELLLIAYGSYGERECIELRYAGVDIVWNSEVSYADGAEIILDEIKYRIDA